jgi:heterodisulfide reductase subunit A
MSNKTKVAVYLSDKINGHTNIVNLHEVKNYIADIPEVVKIWTANDTVLINSKDFASEIKNSSIGRIVLAGFQPGMVKGFFTRVMKEAGLDTNEVLLAGFREHGAVYEKHTDLAKAITLCAINNVPFEEASLAEDNDVCNETLIIGGGIAGIQASLEIADGEQKVYLLEKSGTIGGHMAMFDKTFPTLDCAACILTPKMVEVGQHPNIELLTYAELKSVEGIPGNYKVKILKKARKVNISTCIGCGSCSEKCPGTAKSEFDESTTMRKAIYIPFPQAVPNKYLVDENSCTYLEDPYLILNSTIKKAKQDGLPEELAVKLETLKNKEIVTEKKFKDILNDTIGVENTHKYKDIIFEHTGKCKACIKACPVDNCINLNEEDEEIEITVGNIIVATGFQTFDARKAEQFGYGRFDRVVTSLEFERLVNASGPTGGNITPRIKDKKGNKIFTEEGDSPKRIGIIHCVGSRDENHNKYCSRVCCMYSLKLAHLVKEKNPEAEVYEYFIDMRAFGKGYEEFYERIKKEGVNMIRGKTAKVEEKGDSLVLRSEDIINNRVLEHEVDMLILSVGLEPNNKTRELAKMLGIETDDSGWLKEANYNADPVNTFTGGISVAGVCQGPKDIPDTVAQASAAASRVLQSIVRGKIRQSKKDLNLKDFEKKVKELTY